MDALKREFRTYANWAEGISPMYHRLTRESAEDRSILAIAAEASNGQPPPQLLLAAVHSLLLQGVEHPLRSYYPTCTDQPEALEKADLFQTFRDFCLANEDEIRDIIRSRRVQTNEVGRSAVVMPAIGFVVKEYIQEPICLIEIGASAGLNLFWDRFRFMYRNGGEFGDPNSPVVIESEVRGDECPPFPDPFPEIGERIGIDLNPLDITDSDDADWLRALIIPEQSDRFQRLEAAIDVVKQEPPQLVAGNALDEISNVIENVLDDQGICIYSTHTLYQLSHAERDELRENLETLSHQRPIHWLFNDPDGERDNMTYRWVRLNEGEVEANDVIEHKAYGEWIRWLL